MKALRREDFINTICSEVGITNRKNPRKPYMSKEELRQLLGWIKATKRVNKQYAQ